MKKRSSKLHIVLLLSVVFALILSVCSFAESTDLDRSSYVDGSQYDNEDIDIKHVKVGLLYDKQATDRIYLDVLDGAGFQFMTYNAQREGRELGRVDSNHVVVIKDNFYSDSELNTKCYHVRLNQDYFSYSDARAEADKYEDGFPAYYHGKYSVLFGSFSSIAEASAYASENGLDGHGSTSGQNGVLVLDTATKKPLFGFDMTTAKNLTIAPVEYDSAPVTGFNGKKYYGGFEILRRNGMNLSVINCIDLESYVKGVIPYEMSPSWPIEALKAQALCARTYVAKHMNQYGEYGFDVTDDTHSQVYGGIEGATEDTDSAVDETAGKFIRYKGELCNTYYFSCDGGSTESASLVFGQDYEYLIGKEDPFEAAISFPNKTWNKTITSSQLTSILNSKEYNIGTVMEVSEDFTPSGNCNSLTFTDGSKNSVTLDHTAYNQLGLPSCHFTAEKTKIKVVKKVKKQVPPSPSPSPTPTPAQDGAAAAPTPTPKPTPTPEQYEYITEYYDGFSFNGGGWGHNCGMSQWGAYSMAYAYGYNYEDIIRFYFTGAYIA